MGRARGGERAPFASCAGLHAAPLQRTRQADEGVRLDVADDFLQVLRAEGGFGKRWAGSAGGGASLGRRTNARPAAPGRPALLRAPATQQPAPNQLAPTNQTIDEPDNQPAQITGQSTNLHVRGAVVPGKVRFVLRQRVAARRGDEACASGAEQGRSGAQPGHGRAPGGGPLGSILTKSNSYPCCQPSTLASWPPPG